MKPEQKFIDVDIQRDYDPICTIIRKAAFSVGVTSTISDTEIHFIADFMVREFPHLTIHKFEDAFSKAAASKFETKIESYNNFSLALVGRVIRAYREYSAKLIVERAGMASAMVLVENTDRDPDQVGRQHWEYFQDFIKLGEMPSVGQWATALNWGVKNEKIFITQDELEETRESVRDQLTDELKALGRDDPRVSHELKAILQDTKQFRRECQTRYMKEWVRAQMI